MIIKKFSSNDFTRQTEILARCLSGEVISKADLAFEYDTSEITINRDLSFLRSLGIGIYTRKGKLIIENSPSIETITNLTSDYLPLKLSSGLIAQQILALPEDKRSKILTTLIISAKAVRESKGLEFEYKRFYDDELKTYFLNPIKLYNLNLNWLLDGYKIEDKKFRTFYLSRINSIRILPKVFDEKSFVKNKRKKEKMVFRFHPKVGSQIYDKIWFENISIKKDSHGYTILTTEQEISDKIAGWCVSWWDMIEIIEPLKLKEYVQEMIHKFQEMNKPKD